MEVINVSNLSKNYAEHQALKEVYISVGKQRIFGLLGPNGAGKTTLIRIITQIIQPDQGEIFINGERLSAKHIGLIGYLPEERGLYKKMKVGEQLLYFAQLKGLSHREAVTRAKEWMTRFEIKDWWNKKVEDLSKGMSQKVQFIATVLHQPEIIILDEPFSGFDPINANLVKDEILKMRDNGSTIIFSTHRMESVEELCDDIALIHKSHKILEGTKRDIKEAYRSNTFIVNHQSEISELSNGFEFLEKNKTKENAFRSVIKIGKEDTSNRLLQELINQTQIVGFVEKIPSIDEIFIAKVNETNAIESI